MRCRANSRAKCTPHARRSVVAKYRTAPPSRYARRSASSAAWMPTPPHSRTAGAGRPTPPRRPRQRGCARCQTSAARRKRRPSSRCSMPARAAWHRAPPPAPRSRAGQGSPCRRQRRPGHRRAPERSCSEARRGGWSCPRGGAPPAAARARAALSCRATGQTDAPGLVCPCSAFFTLFFTKRNNDGIGPPQAAWRGAVEHPSGGPSAPGRRCWRLGRKPKRPSPFSNSGPTPLRSDPNLEGLKV